MWLHFITEIPIRSLFVTPFALTVDEAEFLDSSCNNKPIKIMLSMHDIFTGISKPTVNFTIPTKCHGKWKLKCML